MEDLIRQYLQMRQDVDRLKEQIQDLECEKEEVERRMKEVVSSINPASIPTTGRLAVRFEGKTFGIMIRNFDGDVKIVDVKEILFLEL